MGISVHFQDFSRSLCLYPKEKTSPLCWTSSRISSSLKDFNPAYTNDDLLCLYMITGGVAKYVEQLMMCNAVSKDEMIRSTLGLGSYFIDETREMLIDEFGKDYGNYFSVLSALASGYAARGEIKSYTGIEPGGFLDNLDKDYDIVRRKRPYLAGDGSKKVRYDIADSPKCSLQNCRFSPKSSNATEQHRIFAKAV